MISINFTHKNDVTIMPLYPNDCLLANKRTNRNHIESKNKMLNFTIEENINQYFYKIKNLLKKIKYYGSSCY